MLFSIIIPTYNLENYIEHTIQSILKNDCTNSEIILIDDASTDRTVSVAEKLLQGSQVVYKIIKLQINSGVSYARNKGIEIASGSYLIFCDGDDICADNMLNCMEQSCRDNQDMSVCRYFTLMNDKLIVSQKEFTSNAFENEDMFSSFVMGNDKIRLGSFAVKKEMLTKYQITFSEGCHYAEDLEFIYKCLAVAKKIYATNEPLYTYVRRKGSSVDQYDLYRFEASYAMERVYSFVDKFADNKIKNNKTLTYLTTGLYLLHTIYAFDACLSHMKRKDKNSLYTEYRKKYPEIETKLRKMKYKDVIFTSRISKRKQLLFLISRKLYIIIFWSKFNSIK